MNPRPRSIWLFTAALGLILACGPVTSVTSPSGPGSSSSPKSNSSAEPAATTTPLTPNPLNVQITLDTANALTSAGFSQFLGRQGADGNYPFQLNFPAQMVSVEADGTLVPATGTPLTVTPVSAIEGIPFSQGFLKAVDLSPQGLLMVGPATLKLTLPGEYDPATLIGFSSDGNGNNFHLYPVSINVIPLSGGYGGFTEATFDILHFSMYGVAQATTQEILAQHGRVPEGETSQDEDLLAPLTPLSPADALIDSELRELLGRQHDLGIKPAIDRVFAMENDCNYVDVVAQQFINWYARVERVSAQDHFKNEIDRDTSVLLARLIKCMGPLCSLCLGTPPGDRQHTDSFLIHAYYAERISTIAGDYSGAANWRQFANACAQNAGRPMPDPPVATCGQDCGVGGPTPTPLACPVLP
jgi:hypothetical protein